MIKLKHVNICNWQKNSETTMSRLSYRSVLEYRKCAVIFPLNLYRSVSSYRNCQLQEIMECNERCKEIDANI